MRLQIVSLLMVALAAAICGQHLTIDNDLNAPQQPGDVLIIPQWENGFEENLLKGDTDSKQDNPEDDVEVSSEQLEDALPNTTPKPDEIFTVGKPESGISRSNEDLPSGNSKEAIHKEYIVNTTHGPVQGHLWNGLSDILGYIDIPYGKFSGPFRAPTTSEPWENVHQITEHNKRCPQLQLDTYVGEENCLSLSIFTPMNVENASVLFHIHDSNFNNSNNSGSGNPSVYGPEYLVPKGIILVLPNYRLGALGFLCLQNETAPGNAALKDLTLALTWLSENIHSFGGNPLNIAVSGDGTAGALVGYLALSPRSKNYISKVITESGSVLSHWALDRDPIARATKLEENIREEGSFNSLEDADLSTILKAAKDLTLNACLESNMEPFIEDTPWKMLHSDNINVTFMIGSASYAGTQEALDTPESKIKEFNDDFGSFLPIDLKFKSCEERSKVGLKLKTQYFNEEDISLNNIEELSLCYTDASYLGPGIRAARLLVEANATVYFYEFAFVGKFNRELESMNNPVEGAVRRDIVGYLFTQRGVTPEDDSDEKRMINLMVDLWVSFINTGKPQAEKIRWNELKKTEESEEEWLLINSETKSMKGVHGDRLELWTQIYNEHFIERNLAFELKPRFYTAFIMLLAFWIGFCKITAYL